MKKANFVLAIVNLLIMAYLIFRFGMPSVNSTKSFLDETHSIGIFLAAQANQFAILQIMLSILGLGLAVAAFWGYIEIMSRAELRAENTVKETVPKLFSEMLDKFGKQELERMLLETKMTKPLQRNTDETFYEGIKKLQKDPFEMEEINEY